MNDTPKSRRRGFGTLDHHRLWLNTDPCGLFNATIVYAILTFCSYTMLTQVLYPWFGTSVSGVLHMSFYCLFTTLAVLAHLRCMLSNPGAVPRNAKPTDPQFYSRECYKCGNFKPPRAHHCSICGRCVIKMDHHCPWINNCVGLANQKYFMQFLLYICTISLYALGMMTYRMITCLSATGECALTAGTGIMQLFTAIMAVLFALFTGCLLSDQINVVLTNQTGIDRLKKHGHSHGGHEGEHEEDEGEEAGLVGGSNKKAALWRNIAEVVGGDPAKDGISLHWFLPTPIKYKDPESLTGFCFRDVPRPRTDLEMEAV